VFHNALQTITTATDTYLAFNSEQYDQAGNATDTQHDTVTNNSRLTCRYAGVYLIIGGIEWAANTTGVRYLFIRHQGASRIVETTISPATSATHGMNVSTLFPMAVNEYVELGVHQTSGGNLNVNQASFYSPYFQWVRVA
jgi:hypothetical protein